MVINQQKEIDTVYNSVLNESTVDAFPSLFGRTFQSIMVRGENEWLK